MEKMSNYLDFVEEKFYECFNNKGYIEDQPVSIISQVDKTVDFVGSKISPLKHYIIDNNIPQQGVFLIQNCMKLRSLKYLKDDTVQTFGSCYRGMGTLTVYDLNKIVFDTFDYLLNDKYLGISPHDIRIRLNSTDDDLIDSIDMIDNKVLREFDTEDVENYKHIYGLDEQQITGRNFNIAVRKGNTNEFFDCAAIIVMETPSKKVAIDMGIGNSSLAMCKFNKNNTVASSRIADVLEIKDSITMKFADSIVAVSTLLYENILECESKHFRKKFRQYLHALLYWKNKFNISDIEILKYINKYLELEYKTPNYVDEDCFKEVLQKVIKK